MSKATTAGLALALSLCCAPALAAQAAEVDPERRAELARRGAGIQAGVWIPADLPEVQGASYSATPFITAFTRTGLDRHLSWENTLSFWRRRQVHEASGGLGGTSREQVDTYVLPFITSLTFYPATGPEAALEPFLRAGAGVTLGIDHREGTSGGLLGVGGREGTILYTGLGARGGIGVDLRLSPALGLTTALQYQWVHFLEGEPGGTATYRGPVLEAGLTYRFQF